MSTYVKLTVTHVNQSKRVELVVVCKRVTGINDIKVLRDMVDNPPFVLKESIGAEEAIPIINEIEQLGAVVNMQSVSEACQDVQKEESSKTEEQEKSTGQKLSDLESLHRDGESAAKKCKFWGTVIIVVAVCLLCNAYSENLNGPASFAICALIGYGGYSLRTKGARWIINISHEDDAKVYDEINDIKK